ncbi:hypothetical protein ACLOJK_022847 [Asimina triloba]
MCSRAVQCVRAASSGERCDGSQGSNVHASGASSGRSSQVSGTVVGSGAHVEMIVDGWCIGQTNDSGWPRSYDPGICDCLRGWARASAVARMANAEASLAAGDGGDVGAAWARIGVRTGAGNAGW